MARKLLLADDSITIQKVVELVLAEEGFEIKAVNNGEEALAAAATFKPDIVLADIEMPKMNGYQLCEKLKTNPSTKNIPVILLSGAFEPLDEELAKQIKADGFVVKPFESQELIGKINAFLIPQAAMAAEAEEAVAVEAMAIEAEAEAVVAEAVGAEEDLWSMEAMEEVPAEAAAIEEVVAEAVPEESGVEEAFAVAEEINVAEALEEADISAEAVFAQAVEAPAEEAELAEEMAAPVYEKKIVSAPEPLQRQRQMPEMAFPAKEELTSIFKKAAEERVASFLSTMDIKSSLLSSLTPSLKDSIEKVLWEVAPELTEKILREMLQSSLASLSKEIEKVIWETVPEIAERLIAREIEKIKSEI